MRRPVALTALMAGVMSVATAQATVAIALNGPELAAVSDSIVHGRVVNLTGHVDSQSNRVFTDAEIEVLSPLKGASIGTRIRVSYPGGVWGGLGMVVAGQIQLKADHEYVLYLRQHPRGEFMPAAMRQGFYEIQRREYDGIRIAYRSLNGLSLVKRNQGPGFSQVAAVPTPMDVPLTTLLDDIRRDLLAASKLDRDAILPVPR